MKQNRQFLGVATFKVKMHEVNRISYCNIRIRVTMVTVITRCTFLLLSTRQASADDRSDRKLTNFVNFLKIVEIHDHLEPP